MVSEDGTSMSPGNWDDIFPPTGVTHLQEGTYCLNNGLDINSDLSGDKVVFKVESGDIHFSGSADIHLTAPAQGEQKGLLIYVPMDNPNKIVLNGGAESNFRGTILAPASEIHINGNDSQSPDHRLHHRRKWEQQRRDQLPG
jgi:hypothetical protein